MPSKKLVPSPAPVGLLDPVTLDHLTSVLRAVGAVIGLDTLLPHDCRHYWATKAAADDVPLEGLKQAGGWSCVHMPIRYIGDAEIANQGMGRKKKE